MAGQHQHGYSYSPLAGDDEAAVIRATGGEGYKPQLKRDLS